MTLWKTIESVEVRGQRRSKRIWNQPVIKQILEKSFCFTVLGLHLHHVTKTFTSRLTTKLFNNSEECRNLTDAFVNAWCWSCWCGLALNSAVRFIWTTLLNSVSNEIYLLWYSSIKTFFYAIQFMNMDMVDKILNKFFCF